MLTYLRRRAQMKGLFGGSRPWMVLWVALLGARLLRRLVRDKPDIVFSEELPDGETLVVSTRDRSPRVYEVGAAPS